MTASTAKITVRVVGTLVGIYGVLSWAGALLLLGVGGTQEAALLILLTIPLLLGVYCLYVGYLTWWRFSPIAVRHVCGAVGYFSLLCLLGIDGKFLHHPVEPSPGWAFGFLGVLLLVHFLYRLASERLSRLLFPFSLSSEGQT